ncbi:Oidioi.mRNA.OKI2018_I69.XSR.g16253.t1.cds [Oikopleura dioica]|uniref:Oidioi.mRNA.OKI2018_I69.XSR.g16253.t1.cds n=1 Tax=Oikopleura dioica TaxID=34765 RepID=A0ABN7SFG8_OIKDI|nr:Oidioi.mRNA.OKI2018_I69.XSR.g16253.t1.cds [Oikopleura dioica]
MEDFHYLIKWMRSKGFKLDKFPITAYEFDDTGRGIMATEDIDAGSRVLEVPENIILLWVLLFLIAIS